MLLMYLIYWKLRYVRANIGSICLFFFFHWTRISTTKYYLIYGKYGGTKRWTGNGKVSIVFETKTIY